MSSHYIYVACPAKGCEKRDSIYTGSEMLTDFNDREWEGETILAKCIEHDGSQTDA